MSEDLPFTLQQGEKIHAEVKPEKTAFILSYLLVSLLSLAVVGFFLSLFLWRAAPGLLLGLLGLWLLIAIAVPFLQYERYKYWITNMRVIGRRGLIGYSVESIPLENVTDVTLNRSLIEQVLGVSSLLIVPIGGLVVRPRRGGGANYFPALKPGHALELQALLFKLRDIRKKRHHSI
ncbi:MAG: PH domain-containing protein [Candidatus Micrarchaeota archaeon]|nr:PH domain-containing protein [Candidatus Micrarchaeota archaeon]